MGTETRASADLAGAAWWSAGATVVTSGAATRTGASAELPASLRGGGLGLAVAAMTAADRALGLVAGAATAGTGGLGATGGFGETSAEGVGCAGAGLFGAGALAATLAGAALAAAAGGCASRRAWGRGALAGAGRLLEGAGAFVADLRAADAAVGFTASRLAPAGLGCTLPATVLRRADEAALPATRAAGAERAVVRLVAGFAAALGFGRGTGTRRVAVACLAGAAALAFALGAGRAGLFTALPEAGRLPEPLAGVDAFMPAISPSSTGRERRVSSTRFRVSPENLELAIPWTAEPEPT